MPEYLAQRILITYVVNSLFRLLRQLARRTQSAILRNRLNERTDVELVVVPVRLLYAVLNVRRNDPWRATRVQLSDKSMLAWRVGVEISHGGVHDTPPIVLLFASRSASRLALLTTVARTRCQA